MEKIARILLVNGVATITIKGSAKSSVDSKRDGVEMMLTNDGVFVTYEHKGKKERQLVPKGMYYNVQYEPEEISKSKAK
jgi:hypothetical protein